MVIEDKDIAVTGVDGPWERLARDCKAFEKLRYIVNLSYGCHAEADFRLTDAFVQEGEERLFAMDIEFASGHGVETTAQMAFMFDLARLLGWDMELVSVGDTCLNGRKRLTVQLKYNAERESNGGVR